MADKYQVPEEMVATIVGKSGVRGGVVRLILRLAAEWLALHPIVPSEEEAWELWKGASEQGAFDTVRYVIRQWQQQMFLVRDEVPEEVKVLMWVGSTANLVEGTLYESHNKAVLAAYEAGKRSVR